MLFLVYNRWGSVQDLSALCQGTTKEAAEKIVLTKKCVPSAAEAAFTWLLEWTA
jgi:hypothetical protein